jgi:uncharacterized protein YbcI
MGMTSAQIKAWLDEIEGIRSGKPKVVVKENEVVRDADPHVSKADPNYAKSDEGVVKVRRDDWVTIRVDLWEQQQRERREERLRRRELDPFRLGHWGTDEDE